MDTKTDHGHTTGDIVATIGQDEGLHLQRLADPRHLRQLMTTMPTDSSNKLLSNLVSSALTVMPKEKKAGAVKEAIEAQPEGRQLAKAVVTEIRSPLGSPGQWARDTLWIIVVASFAIVLVGSFATLAAGVSGNQVKPELILTMFTSVVGFLAGLFVPSPIGRGTT